MRATLALLIVGTLGLFVLAPLAEMGLIHSRFALYAYWIFLMLGVAVITNHPIVRWLEIVCALGATIADQVDGTTARLVEGAFMLAYVLLLGGVLWQRVFARGRVTAEKLVSAVTIYLLIGVFFSELFHLIEVLLPGSFRFGPDFGGAPIDSNLRYFSFITLTTVGYGDATPAVPIAHATAVLEALIGQLYLAILIGRLVSNLQIPAEEP